MNLFKISFCGGKVVAIMILLLFPMQVSGQNKDIFQMISNYDSVGVKQVIESDPALVNAQSKSGLTPLLYAVAVGNYEISKLLIEHGALTRVADKNLRAPIHYANWNNDKEIIELLIANGAVIDTRAIGGATPLIHSSLSNKFDMSKFLIEKGADINIQCNSLTTPLYFAVLNNNMEYFDFLNNAGADIDVPDYVDRTPLYVAVRDGNKPMAEKLLQSGADAFIKDKFLNRSLLHIAAIEGHTDVVEYLIKVGIDVNEKDKSGNTPIYYAAEYGNYSTLEMLIKNGADKQPAPNPKESIIRNELKLGEAGIVKLQNGGWGINTKNRFFTFAYSEIGAAPTDKSILNGHITNEEFINTKQLVVVDHDFHSLDNPFSINGYTPLPAMQNTNPNILYAYNYRHEGRYIKQELKNVRYLKPNEKLDFDGMKIEILPAYGANLCYIIDVDELIIVWLTGICDNYLSYKKDVTVIDELIKRNIKPDILLLGSPAGIGPEIAQGIREAYLESEKLNAKAVFALGPEPVERKINYQINRRRKNITNFYCSDNPGDVFKLTIDGKVVKQ